MRSENSLDQTHYRRWRCFVENQSKLRSQAVFGGVDFLINCDYDVKLLNVEQLPEFYRTLLCYWQEFKLSTDSKEIPVYDQIIWNNHNIRLDGKTIFITEWYEKASSTSMICLMLTFIFCP